MKKLLTIAFLLCSILQAVADTWTDSNGIVWSFSIENGNAVGVKPNDISSITGDLVIPENMDSYPVRTFGEDAFYNCSALTSITIPSNVTTIGARAFSGCTHLSSIHITDLSAWCGITFSNSESNPLYYGHHLFLNGEEITDLVIPSGISLLKSYAFSGGYFSSVTIPSGCLFTNSKCVFAFAHIGSITINQYLAEETFVQAQIGNLMIAPEVTYGGYHAFWDTKIDNLEIPYSSETLGYSYGSNSYALFDGCTINKATVNRQISSSYYGSKVSPFYLGSIKELHVGSNTWYNYDNLCGRVTVDDLYFDGITDISANAFYSTSPNTNNIYNIHLSDEVSSIGSYAFYNCGLNTVFAEMPSPPAIDSYTFNDSFHRSLATLYVPSGCKAAYEAADYWKEFGTIVEIISFADANVKEICVANWDTNGDGELSVAEAAAVTDIGVVFEENRDITSFDELRFFTGLTSIGYNAFRRCEAMTSIIIPGNVTDIGAAFCACTSLNSVTIPASVTGIHAQAFSWCTNLASIHVEEGNSTYDSRENCNAIITTALNRMERGCRNTVFPNSVTIIGSSCFEGSDITTIDIPSTITVIRRQSFRDCNGLTSIVIPNSVTSIEYGAFNRCDNLNEVYVNWETPVAITEDVFSNRTNATLYVPAGSKAAYQTADYWKEFKNIIETFTTNTVEDVAITFEITSEANKQCQVIGSSGFPAINSSTTGAVTIPSVVNGYSVTSIGVSAFRDCSSLSSITIPNSVTSIGNSAFRSCSGLTSITIPNSVTNIGKATFLGCSGLTSITISNSMTSIGNHAFENCI